MPTSTRHQSFGIEAVRTAGSIFGAATAWVKDRDGQAEKYETLEDARAEAERLNRAIVSPNVYYVAKPMEPAGRELVDDGEHEDFRDDPEADC